MSALAPDGVTVVQAVPGHTWATAILLAASTGSGPALVLSPDPAVGVATSVRDLIGAHGLGIGSVVPAVTTPDGALLEAGADRVDGALISTGHGSGQFPTACRVPRDVDGTRYPWMAVRRDLVPFLDLDPAMDDLQTIVDQATRAIVARHLRVVYDPSWTVTTSPEPPGCAPDARAPISTAATSGPAILIVSGFVPSDRFRAGDRSVLALVTDLAEQVEDSRITVVAADGFRAGAAAAALRQMGVEVVVPPIDWRLWFRANLARFSHVFATWSGLQSDLGSWIRRTQPQAVKVLFLPGLAYRDIESLRPSTPSDEIEGLECVRVASEARLSELAMWFDAAWCERPVDASYLHGQHPDLTVCVVPPASSDRAPAPPPAGPETPSVPSGEAREVVILVPEGHDVVKANEEAAIFSLSEILPGLRRRNPDLRCTVLSETPTPRLITACRTHACRLASFDQAATVLRRAALMVVGHQHGTGGSISITTALEARIPFVATPIAAQHVPLGDLTPAAVFSSVPDLVTHGRRLLGDRRAQGRFLAGIDRLASGPMSPSRRRAALRTALAQVALTPTVRPTAAWPAASPPEPSRPPMAFARLRPEGYLGEPPDAAPEPETETDRYRAWLRRFATNDTTLDQFRTDLETMAYRPVISVLMSVFDTDPRLLTEAVASVTSQIYEHWQLCIVDDGSQRPETVDVLRAIAEQPSIEVARLGEPAGIAAATNVALAAAGGEYVTFLTADGLLRAHALAQVVRWLNADHTLDVIYSDEDESDGHGSIVRAHLKPDWSPDRLMDQDYIGNMTVMRRSLLDGLGGLRPSLDGSHHYDLMLRADEVTNRIAHIPEPLYTGRTRAGEPGAADGDAGRDRAAKRALADALDRRQLGGSIEDTPWPGLYRTRYALPGQPRVAVVIPTKDGLNLLRRCMDSILEKTTYRNYELVIIDNESSDGDTLGYLASLPARVIRYPHRFNYARMLNLAATTTDCDALLFLNNDTEIITPEWIEALLEHGMRPEVGAVGCRLYFGDGRPQHEGMLIGGFDWNIAHQGYHHLGEIVRNVSAVTGACTMIRPSVYGRVGGNDERLRVAFNDVDICLRIRQAGFEVIYTPYAELFHYESSTRNFQEHAEDTPLFYRRWEPRLRVDPYHSPLYQRDQFFRIDLVDKYG